LWLFALFLIYFFYFFDTVDRPNKADSSSIFDKSIVPVFDWFERKFEINDGTELTEPWLEFMELFCETIEGLTDGRLWTLSYYKVPRLMTDIAPSSSSRSTMSLFTFFEFKIGVIGVFYYKLMEFGWIKLLEWG
jgi:hypothetical protein